VILTARMRLVPATVALARAELMDRPGFAQILSAVVPDEWPPEMLADALPTFLEFIEAAPDQVGWFVWYAIVRGSGSTPDVLAASGGFKGPPEDGTVELGYSVLPRIPGPRLRHRNGPRPRRLGLLPAGCPPNRRRDH
jgi:[ribosomal protein S5]-alanine N-acetyltransferase